MAKATRKIGRSLDTYLSKHLTDPEFRRPFEQRLARLRRPSQEEYFHHELLHGAYLVHSLLEIVGRSGEAGAKRDRLFKKHPKLRPAHERALAATWALYQAVGRAQVDVD